MTNHCDRRRLRSLIFSCMDNLNEVDRARKLTTILWDIQTSADPSESDWEKVELLLECYEKKRDKYLELALSDLEQLRQIITRQ